MIVFSAKVITNARRHTVSRAIQLRIGYSTLKSYFEKVEASGKDYS